MQLDNITIEKKEKSTIEIKGEIGLASFEESRKEAIAKLAEHIEIDGFRKGKAPEDMVVKKLGEPVILEEMAQITLSKAYPHILREHAIDAIGYPRIAITKLAAGNPLGFTITTAVLPTFTLPDYKKIAEEERQKPQETAVTPEEIAAFEKNLRRAKAHDDFHKAHPEVTDHNHEQVKDEDLPELDLAYVQTLGDFKDMDDFRTKIHADMQKDKEVRAQEKTRLAIIEAITEKTEIDVPEILIESEIEKMLARMKGDIERMGMKYEDYLTALKKTDADIRKDFQGDALKRAKVQMIVGEIAVKEGLKPSEENVAAEVQKIRETYKDVDERSARMYIENVLMNEEVFRFLEGKK